MPINQQLIASLPETPLRD